MKIVFIIFLVIQFTSLAGLIYYTVGSIIEDINLNRWLKKWDARQKWIDENVRIIMKGNNNSFIDIVCSNVHSPEN